MGEARLTCFPLTLAEARALRPHYWRYLESAIADADGRLLPDDVWADIDAGRVSVWLVVDGEQLLCAATLGIYSNAVTRWAEVELCGGVRSREWFDLGLSQMARWARHHGCDSLMVEGRHGWTKGLKRLGFDVRRVQATLRLRNEQEVEADADDKPAVGADAGPNNPQLGVRR